MKHLKLNIFIEEYENEQQMKADDRELLIEARKTVHDAYAPYSAFNVGAALRLENGVICIGNNQENVAYPSGLCAERVALFYASSKYPDIPVCAIAVTALSNKYIIDNPVAPCGACRQVLAEYEIKQQRKIRMIFSGEKGKIHMVEGVENILPFMFRMDYLKK